MILKTFVQGPIEDNNYLLIDEKTKDAILIDCTEESENIENAIKESGANLKYILLTHGHFDHIMGVNHFRKKYGAKAFIHEADKPLIADMNNFLKKYMMEQGEIQQMDGTLVDGDSFRFGDKEVFVIHTPGHTKGGVCYLVDDKLFSGDTIFLESVGRTDLDGGNFEQLKESIVNKVFTLADNIEIYPGHGSKTTIKHEKENNRFM